MIDDDELTVELVADRGDSRRQRRWPVLVLLVTIVAVVVLVGRLDSGEGATSLPKTTTTTPTSTIRNGTTPPSVTTSMSYPTFEPGTGSGFTAGAGTFIVGIDPHGLITVTDLGTGARCRNRRGDGAWFLRGVTNMSGAAVLQTPNGVVLVSPHCELTSLTSSTDSFPLATGEQSVWIGEGDGSRITEIYRDGSRGRSIDLPAGSGPTVVVAGTDVVIGLNGSMTVVDGNSRRRSLGAGIPLAGRGHHLAFTTCPALRCTLVLLDLATGHRRAIEDPSVAASVYGEPSFSSDEQYLATKTAHEGAAIINVATGSVGRTGADSIVGFTQDSQWFLAAQHGQVRAFRTVGDSEGIDITTGTATGSDDAPAMTVLLAPPRL